MNNEAFERVSLERAFKCALTKATQLYLDGKDEYVAEQFYRGREDNDYCIVVESWDTTTVYLYVRNQNLPEGDLGWLTASFSIDAICRGKLLDAMYALTKILDE